MSAKHLNKKNTRHKKILINTAATTKRDNVSYDLSSGRGREAAIVRQFNQIQKDYSRLVSDVAKELDLVRVWIEKQAISKRDEFKTRLSARLSRD